MADIVLLNLSLEKEHKCFKAIKYYKKSQFNSCLTLHKLN